MVVIVVIRRDQWACILWAIKDEIGGKQKSCNNKRERDEGKKWMQIVGERIKTTWNAKLTSWLQHDANKNNGFSNIGYFVANVCCNYRQQFCKLDLSICFAYKFRITIEIR